MIQVVLSLLLNSSSPALAAEVPAQPAFGTLPPTALSTSHLAPRPFRVVIDPGHGGTDTGTIYNDRGRMITEKDVTLMLARRVAAELKARGFTADHFGAIHPGGKLGAALKRVRDIMRVGGEDPLISPNATVPEAMKAMSAGGIGAAGVVENGKLIGIVTDGDLRRKLSPEMFAKTARDIMTSAPKTIAPDAPIADAIAIMNDKRITLLFAVEDGRPVGVVHMHDLLAAGVR